MIPSSFEGDCCCCSRNLKSFDPKTTTTTTTTVDAKVISECDTNHSHFALALNETSSSEVRVSGNSVF